MRRSVILLLCLMPMSALAGLSFEEILYDQEIVEQSLEEDELKRIQQQQREAREAEQQREQERREQEHLYQQEEAKRLAARPIGVQLIEARCLSCHGMELIEDKRYGLPGWHLTIARMRIWHQAPLSTAEAHQISQYLSQTRRATPLRQWLEYIGIISLPLFVGRFLYRRYRRIRITS